MNIYHMSGARAYARVGLETGAEGADPHRLIAMLFEGALMSVALARKHMLAREIEAKGMAISRAVQIVDEGLKASLNLDAGGGLAQQLWQLYEYIGRRLLLASLRNEPEGLDEVTRLLRDLKEAWDQIDPKVNAANAVNASSAANAQPRRAVAA